MKVVFEITFTTFGYHETNKTRHKLATNSPQTCHKLATNYKYTLLISLALTFLIFSGLKAQGQDGNSPQRLVNCYQNIPIESGVDINLLKTDFTQFIFGGGRPRYMQITGYLNDGSLFGWDGTGELWEYFGLVDDVFDDYYLTVQNGDNEGDQIRVVELYTFDEYGDVIFNPNYFDFSDGLAYFDIVMFTPNEFGNLDPSSTIRVNLLSNEEAFNIEPVTDENECVTYSNFKTSIDLNLSYFCGRIVYSVDVRPEDNHSYLENSSGELVPGGSQNENIPFDDYCLEECFTMSAPEGPGPIPCGCRLFNLKTVIYPCESKILDPNCPPIEFSKNIEICCSCDITFYPDN